MILFIYCVCVKGTIIYIVDGYTHMHTRGKRGKRNEDYMGHPIAHAIQIAFCLGKIDSLPIFDDTRKRYSGR